MSYLVFATTLQGRSSFRPYSTREVFAIKETGLWWKLIPSKTLISDGETNVKNFKQSKDRVTLLACVMLLDLVKFRWPSYIGVPGLAASNTLIWNASQLVILYKNDLGWMLKFFNFGFNSNSYLT